MTKEDKQWLKENEPWRYDDLFGDPVTGFSNEDNFGCLDFVLMIICIIIGIITYRLIF